MLDATPPFHPLPPTAPRRIDGRIVNAMTVDVEEHFQVQALAGQVSRGSWEHRASRVEASTLRVLDLFARHNVKGTFFTLGWVAERHPPLIRRIVAAGHELASHGYEHTRVDSQTPNAFRADIRRTKDILENAAGVAVHGYRAATFSIGQRNLWAFSILAEEGYAYSSSVNPIRHDLYGMANAPRFPFHPVDSEDFIEVPITTVRMVGRNMPCGGGGFFRLLPYAWSRWAIGQVNAADRQPSMFYFHPWEVDPQQPREAGLPLKSRLRHYVNLDRMEAKLDRLLSDFLWDRVDRSFLSHLGATP